ncbi:MAG: hypothetical protein U1E76_12775 [Planctomycetota bacterium]
MRHIAAPWWFRPFAGAALLSSAPACVLVVAGAAVLLTLNLVAEDTVRSTIKDIAADKVYASACHVLEQQGKVTGKNAAAFTVDADVGAHHVKVSVIALEQNEVAIDVKARSLASLTPSPVTAREITVAILQDLGVPATPKYN